MKINSELERVLLGEQAKSQKPAVSSGNAAANAFGNLLESELSVTNNAQVEKSSSEDIAQANKLSDSLVLSADPLASVTASKVSADEKNVVESLVSGINDTIEGMDAYSNSLQSPAGLKQAWSSLNEMNQGIGAMQKDYAKLSNKNTSIGSMLNDLEVMGVTETYKFNRGDYL